MNHHRLSIRQSKNDPSSGAGFARQRRAAVTLYAAKLLGRRNRPIVGFLVLLLISASSATTFAEEPAPVEKAAKIYNGKLAKKFPPNRATPCPDQCKDKQEALNAAWQELYRFDQVHPDIRAVHSAWNQEIAAKNALAAAKKAGTGVKEAQAAVDTASANSAATEKKVKATSTAFQKEASKLDIILKKIDDAADALEACEKNCPQQAQPPLKFPAIPDCTKPDFEQKKEAFLKEMQKLRDANFKELGGPHSGGKYEELGNTDPSNPKYAKLKEEVGQLKAERDAINAHQEAAEKAWGKCPPGGGGGKESEEEEEEEETGLEPSETIAVDIATDGGEWCTYGDGVALHTSIVVTDEAGTPVADIGPRETPTPPEGTPETPELTEKVPEQPPTTPETPELTEKVPEQPPTTPETPELTEKVPEQPPTTPETPELTEKVPEEQPPSEIPDTIFVKAKESVLEGEPTGKPIENQVVKLFPPEEPELPGTSVNKQAEDTGFDKDPVECTTGADGDCKMQVPVEDRALYDLPSTDEKPGKNYRVDYDLPKDSGGVAETTGKRIKPDVKTGTPDGAEVTVAEFKIGDRTFIRLVYEQPYGLDHDFDEQFKPILGDGYEEDYCREKQPGAPLGMQPDSLSSLNHDLPEATVKLGGTVPAPGDTP